MACNGIKRAWNSITDFFTDVWGALSDAAQTLWKEAVRPIIGEAFALLGIEDEQIILVDKSSHLLFDTNTVDPIKNSKKKAVIANVKKGGGFHRWYIAYKNKPSNDMKSYFTQAKKGKYVHGLPTAEIQEGEINYEAIETGIELDTGIVNVNSLSLKTTTPSDLEYFKANLQGSPYYYKPWNNTLTFTDPNGVVQTDYKIDNVVFNATYKRYIINIYRGSNPAITGFILRNNYVKKLSLVVRYHNALNPVDEWYLWIYPLSDNRYIGIKPEIGILSDMEMMPAAIIKDANGAINIDKTTNVYKSTRNLLRAIGLDINDLIDEISADSNYGLVQEAYINFSMSPNDTDELISKALWMSFHNIVVENPVGIGPGEYKATFIEENIKNAAVWSDQNIDYSQIGGLPDNKEYHHYIEDYIYPSEENFDGGGNPHNAEGTKLIIKKVTSPGLLHDKITINNFSTMATISRENHTDVALQDIRSPACTIPLSWYIVSQMSKEEQMYLFEKTLRLDVYAADIQELAWYETKSFLSLFEGVLTIVSVVFTFGSGNSAIEILKRLLITYTISILVIEIAIRTGNEELAALIGVVAMIATKQIDIDKLGLMSAESLLQASTNFADNLTNIYDVQMQELSSEMDYINTEYEKRMEEHKEVAGDTAQLDAAFMAALNSVDTTMYPARDAQYNFDLIYNYGNLIKDYYNLNFRTGVS